jgi:hypothetical protein
MVEHTTDNRATKDRYLLVVPRILSLGVAQPGSASGLEPEGRRFESYRLDLVFLFKRN